MATGNRGLSEFTVKEATNLLAQRKVIRVTPTLSIGSPTAYQSGDPMFNNVEIPNAVLYPGGASLLYGVAMFNKDNEDIIHHLILHQTSGEVLGTVNPGIGAVDISDSNFAALNFLSYIHFVAADIHQVSTLSYGHATPTADTMPIVLQADAGSTSVYFGGIMLDTPTFASTTDLTYIFHIGY